MQEFGYLSVAQLFMSMCQKQKASRRLGEHGQYGLGGSAGREEMYLEIIYLVLL